MQSLKCVEPTLLLHALEGMEMRDGTLHDQALRLALDSVGCEMPNDCFLQLLAHMGFQHTYPSGAPQMFQYRFSHISKNVAIDTLLQLLHKHSVARDNSARAAAAYVAPVVKAARSLLQESFIVNSVPETNLSATNPAELKSESPSKSRVPAAQRGDINFINGFFREQPVDSLSAMAVLASNVDAAEQRINVDRSEQYLAKTGIRLPLKLTLAEQTAAFAATLALEKNPCVRTEQTTGTLQNKANMLPMPKTNQVSKADTMAASAKVDAVISGNKVQVFGSSFLHILSTPLSHNSSRTSTR